MRRYLLRRVVQSVITFFLFLTIVFFLMEAQPGDYGNIFLNDPRLTPEQRAILEHNLGLDRPAYERYLIWMRNFFRGDFGISFSNYPRTVADVIAERAPRTIMLFLTSTVVSFYCGFLAGKILAWRRGGRFEYLLTMAGVGLYTVFTPWFGLMMILIFAYALDWFPIGQFIDPVLWRESPETITSNGVFIQMLLTALVSSLALFGWLLLSQRVDPKRRTRFRWLGVGVIGLGIVGYWAFFSGGAGIYALDILHHMVLPVLTLTLIAFAGTMLLTRNSMLETLREDYILTARAKGLTEKVVRDKHAARNALLPVVTSLIFSLASVLNGGVITENIFSWRGMGTTLITAVQQLDIPTAIGTLVFTGALTLVGHLVVDILYAYLDPRIRYT